MTESIARTRGDACALSAWADALPTVADPSKLVLTLHELDGHGEALLQEALDRWFAHYGLRVQGSLDFGRDAAWVTDLPEGLAVDGDLDLRGCRDLRSLPYGLTVAGTLFLGPTTLRGLDLPQLHRRLPGALGPIVRCA
jgi:hypothetical protein